MTDKKLAAMPGAMAESFKTREVAAQGLREKWQEGSQREKQAGCVSPPGPVSLGWLGRCQNFKQGERTSVWRVHRMACEWGKHLLETESESEVTQSCPTLCDPMDYSLPGSSVHGIFQARILGWVAISFSRGSSQPPWTIAYQVLQSMGFSRQEY